jgi:butyryl-CoA dehydrogenase
MDLSDEQKMIQETASKIAQQELAPKAADVDRAQNFPRDGLQKLAEAGFLGITVPDVLGGGGSDTLSFVLVTEAIAKACASTALVFITHSVVARALVVAGSDEQKKRFLPELVAGKKMAAFALTEPASGSNPFAIATKASKDGDDFTVNGTKVFITKQTCIWLYCIQIRLRVQLICRSLLSKKELPASPLVKRRTIWDYEVLQMES